MNDKLCPECKHTIGQHGYPFPDGSTCNLVGCHCKRTYSELVAEVGA